MPRLFHFGRVVDEVYLRVGAFEHQIVAPRCFVLTMHEDPPFYGIGFTPVQHCNRQSLIGHEDTMCRERLLMVDRSLHCPKYTFKIAPHAPDARLNGFSEPWRKSRFSGFGAGEFEGCAVVATATPPLRELHRSRSP